MQKPYLLILYFVVLIFSSAHLHAQKIEFVTEHYPPYQIKVGDKLTGFGVEIVNEIIERANLDARITVLPWDRAYRLAQEKSDTFIFTIARTKEREQLFKWQEAYLQATTAFFSLNDDRQLKLNSIEEAKKYTTCVVRDDTAAVRLKNYGFNQQNLKFVTYQQQCVKMLFDKRVDFNFSIEHGFFDTLDKLGQNSEAIKKVYVESQFPLGIAANKNTSEELMNKLGKAQNSLKEDGTLSRITRKWFPNLP